MRRKLKRLKSRQDKQKQFTKQEAIYAVGQHLSGHALTLVQTQIINSDRKAQGRRWTIKDKAIALSLYHSSPKTYRILCKIITLPSRSTLANSVKDLNIQPGFSQALLHAFRSKVKVIPPEDRVCAVVFDEMSIKAGLVYFKGSDTIEGLQDLGPILGKSQTIATHALVFMARGINRKWKQPIGYFLTGSTVAPAILKMLIVEAVTQCKSVGLTPILLLCDQGSNNRSCLETLLNVTVEQPYFRHGDDTVIVMYDPPHLVKNIRNNLKNNGFVVDGNSVSWDHLEAFYEADSKFTERFARKLTAKHLQLPAFTSMKVRYAAQILSESAADGIKVMCQLKILPEECLHTAKFCQIFDNLFNVFNSRTIKSSKPFMHALRKTSNHWAFLEEARMYIQAIRPHNTQKLPCLEGWLMNINALKLVFERNSSPLLLTSRCNQDCIENLFFQIRSKGGSRNNPNATQFRAAIRDVMVGMLTAQSEGTNCKVDVDNFLLSLQDFSGSTVETSHSPVPPTQPSQPRTPALHCTITDEHNYSMSLIDTEEEDVEIQRAVQHSNVLAYIAGYILRKIDNDCQTCTTLCRTSLDEQSHNATYKLIAAKENVSGALYVPSHAVVQFISAIDSVFTKTIQQYHVNGIRQRMINNILLQQPVPQSLECCGVGARIVSLYTTIKIFQSVNLFNEKIIHCRKSRKFLKLSNL